MPTINGVLETCLPVENLEHSARFYENLFGFRRLQSDVRLCALDVSGKDVLLLFLRGATLEPVSSPGGIIPPHNASGHSHLAFGIPATDLAAWESKLAEANVAVESRVHWERGGESLYFRDPDNHLVELATHGVWPTY